MSNPRFVDSISIHAPTRGATYCQNQSQIRQRISIHAPTRGATATAVPFATCSDISIHAPTRGATGLYSFCAVDS